jgi:hypothetical protein
MESQRTILWNGKSAALARGTARTASGLDECELLLPSRNGMMDSPCKCLLIGPNETFGCAVLRIDKHDVLWIAAWRVDREEDDRVCQDFRQRVHRSAFEKEQLSGAELGAGAFIFHPECASAGEHVEILVASCVIVRRRWLIDAEDARARRFSICEVVIHEERGSRLGQSGRDFSDVESACVDGCLVHIGFAVSVFRFIGIS